MSTVTYAQPRAVSHRRSRRVPRFTKDHDGRAIVLVPIASQDQPAKLFQEDFEALMKTGITDQWHYNNNGVDCSYVRCAVGRGTDKTMTVARLIMRPRAGVIIGYRDGNRLNLRRDNLELGTGRAKARERMTMAIPLAA